MQTIVFYGASDDLIEIEGDIAGCDEYNGERGVFVVAGLRVAVEYGARGVWGIAVEQVDESVDVTAVDMKLGIQPRSDNEGQGYSMRLEMCVPDGSSVTREASE